MKCEENVKNDITSEIKKNETNTEWNITGKQRVRNNGGLSSQWFRVCKKCNKNVYYFNKITLQYSINQNRDLCDSCKHAIREKNVNYNRNCPNCGEKLIYSCYIACERANRKNTKCNKCAQFRGHLMEPFKRNCPICNKEIVHKNKSTANKAIKNNRTCLSCSISKKNRLRHQRYREKWGFVTVPCFNRNACKYFDDLDKQNGWNLQHALNGGECNLSKIGYWLDAYDKEKNIVVEYDERKHFTKNGELKKKDIDRMAEICNHLKCDFWRYNEKKGTLKKYEY